MVYHLKNQNMKFAHNILYKIQKVLGFTSSTDINLIR